MCLYGNYREIKVNCTSKTDNIVLIDACIASEIQDLNRIGVQTLGCCCSHGEAGRIVEYENINGKWKETTPPAHVLLKKESAKLIAFLGYVVYPFYYVDGEHYDVCIAILKTGCNTEEECRRWHSDHSLPYKKNLGVIK